MLVEAQIQDKTILVLFRCSSSDQKKVLLAKHRSEVISEIREVLSSPNKAHEFSENVLFPVPTDFKFVYSPSGDDIRCPLVSLRRAFEHEPHSRSIEINNSPQVEPISSILGFDAYLPLDTSTLCLLNGNDNTPQTLKQCFDILRSEIGSDKLKLILNVSIITDDIHTKWIQKYETDEPKQKLRDQLDMYSLFKLSDLHIVLNSSSEHI